MEASQHCESHIMYRGSCIVCDGASSGLLQQDSCFSGSLVRLKRHAMFQSRVAAPNIVTAVLPVWTADCKWPRADDMVLFAIGRWSLRPMAAETIQIGFVGNVVVSMCRKKSMLSPAFPLLQIWAEADSDGELHFQGHRDRGFPWRLIATEGPAHPGWD